MASRLQCNYSRLPIGGSDRVKKPGRTSAGALAAKTWPLVAGADDVGLVSK